MFKINLKLERNAYWYSIIYIQMQCCTRDVLDEISDRWALRLSAEYDVIFPRLVCRRRLRWSGDEEWLFCANRARLPVDKGVECW